MQPWDFVLIRARALRQRIYDHFRTVNESAGNVYEGARAERYRALKLQGILDAPLNRLVTCDRSRGGPHVLGRYTMRHTDEYSTCLAVQNLWLAARAEGVGVGWMSLFEPQFVAEQLGLPEHVVPAVTLPAHVGDKPTLYEHLRLRYSGDFSEHVVDRYCVAGTPDECAGRVREYEGPASQAPAWAQPSKSK